MIPVIVVTGFLGSGKTTLIGRLLGDPRLEQTAIIVNELGEAAVDHHLLRRIDEQTVLLANGCVCCSLRSDLRDELQDLLNRRDRHEVPHFERVIIETTGIAEPSPIVQTILGDPVIRNQFRLQLLLATVDAMHGFGAPEAVKQISAADRIVITKCDAVTPQVVSALSAAVRQINPAAGQIEGHNGVVDPELLLAEPSQRPFTGHSETPHDHLDGVSAHCLAFEGRVDWNAFAVWLTMLLASHGENVLRVKGLLDVGDGGPIVLNGVQHAIHPPIHLDSWPDGDRRSRLVFIVRHIERDRLERSLRAFQAVTEPVGV